MDEDKKPGSIITPGSKSEAEKPVQPAQPVQPAAPVGSVSAEPASNWQFSGSAQPVGSFDDDPALSSVEWTASEFIAHEKGAGWYALVAAGTVAVAAFTYLLAHDRFTTALIVIVGILFAIMGARKPRELKYVIDDHGITIGEKFYGYSNFKSFSIVQEGGIESIWFAPLKRFMPSLSIYFAPPDGSKIIDTLSQFLPVESRTLDPIDRLMHRIGF